MTSDLPVVGGDFSDWVWMILVGMASYCFSFASALATPPLAACVVSAELVADPAELDEVAELDELDEPHAANAAAVARATASAASRRNRL
jgi:hypothetical protein